jgi:transposase
MKMLEAGFFVAGDVGDVLGTDNAPIHTQVEVLHIILDLQDAHGVNLFLQPAYSPEFNACERGFSIIKNTLRNQRISQPPLEQIASILASISRDEIEMRNI